MTAWAMSSARRAYSAPMASSSSMRSAAEVALNAGKAWCAALLARSASAPPPRESAGPTGGGIRQVLDVAVIWRGPLAVDVEMPCSSVDVAMLRFWHGGFLFVRGIMATVNGASTAGSSRPRPSPRFGGPGRLKPLVLALLRREHAAEAHLPRGQPVVGFGGLVECEGLHNGLDLALAGEVEDLAEVVQAAVGGSDDLQVLRYTGGTLVMPMAVLVEQYWREISSAQNQHAIPVRHFVLHADQETLRKRILDDAVMGPSSFRLEYLAAYAEAALTWLHDEAEVINTVDVTVAQVATRITGAISYGEA